MIRVGIIGLGFGKNVHVPAFRLDPRCEVVSICGTDPARTQEAALTLGIARSTADWRDLVHDAKIDAIAISTPPLVQAKILGPAIAAGKHIFCEKPLGTGAMTAKSLAEKADAAKIAHMVDFEFPELDTWQAARAELRTMGTVRSVKLTWKTQTVAHKKGLKIWKTNSTEGGGTFQNLGTHSLYYLEWLMGPIKTVRAGLGPSEEPVSLQFIFESGATGEAIISANDPSEQTHKLEFFCQQGELILENSTSDYMTGFTLKGAKAGEKLKTMATEGTGSHPDGRVRAVGRVLSKFLNWIETGERQEPNLWQAHRNEVLLEKARGRS